jgi:hypothetical protein
MGTRNRVIVLARQATLASGIGSLESIPRLHNMKNEDEDEDNFFGLKRRKTNIFVPQLSKERRKTKLFVPKLSKERSQPKFLFLNHQRSEEKLMHSSHYYQSDEEK